MEEGTFEKVGQSEKRMYGPKGIIVCGYPPSEHSFLLMFTEKAGFHDRPVIFAGSNDASTCLKEILSLPALWGMGEVSEMPRALILSGFTHKELHQVMSAYRHAGLPRQFWATLTPVSETWTVGRLLEELQKENKALSKSSS
ncbi:MAG: DUF3783 domain-containing protein [Deltaproteobacteria bacterium]|nr:DUF3783 domain-containing protein [Deltaproteobacteria bacterium]